MSEIRRVDPEARRRALLIVASGAALGTLLIAGYGHFYEPFREWLMSGAAENAFRVIFTLSIGIMALFAPVFGIAIYLWLLGAKIVRAAEYPPPGAPVIRDTPIVRGSGAVRRGRALQVVALSLVIAVASLCFWVWQLLSGFRDS